MILSAKEILKRLSDGSIGICPKPDLTDLARGSSAAVDLRLGSWFMSLQKNRLTHLAQPGGPTSTGVYDPDLTMRREATREVFVPLGRGYVIHPGEFVLGITLEWVSLPFNVTAYVLGKSRWGRRGLVIATATCVHPLFSGCLTLELANVGEVPLALCAGTEVCQLSMAEVLGADVPAAQGGAVVASQFSGKRKPVLGNTEQDNFVQALSRANQLRNFPGLSGSSGTSNY
ncbi:MAG: dCTP deaminase [bacterium]